MEFPSYNSKRIEWATPVGGDPKFLEKSLMKCLEMEGGHPGGEGAGVFLKRLKDPTFNKSKNNFYMRE